MNAQPPPSARCWAEIDLGALAHNAGVAREFAGGRCELLAVVKADAYGHGMTPVAQALFERAGVSRFAVANVAEAIELAEGLPAATTITILSPALPTERPEIVHHGFIPWISTLEEGADYARLAGELRAGGEPCSVEIAVDTGMGREGVLPDDLNALRVRIDRLPGVRVVGLASHLPVPDEDNAFTLAQLARFERLTPLHAPFYGQGRQTKNSAGILRFSRAAPSSTLARPGLMLYGASPLAEFQARLRPVLGWKTRVTLVRDLPAGHGISYGRTFITPRQMRVGTLAVGYADGYQRHLSNAGAEVLIRGQRCPVLGRITMDQIVVDLSAVPAVEPGEEVTLIGRQGEEEILAAELAARAGTIPWEIFTGIGPRVGRYYVG